jgi:hypothetical protein
MTIVNCDALTFDQCCESARIRKFLSESEKSSQSDSDHGLNPETVYKKKKLLWKIADRSNTWKRKKTNFFSSGKMFPIVQVQEH